MAPVVLICRIIMVCIITVNILIAIRDPSQWLNVGVAGYGIGMLSAWVYLDITRRDR